MAGLDMCAYGIGGATSKTCIYWVGITSGEVWSWWNKKMGKRNGLVWVYPIVLA